ncbi:MAG: tetratricopeptide repeat protein [Bacteroidota bacterium]
MLYFKKIFRQILPAALPCLLLATAATPAFSQKTLSQTDAERYYQTGLELIEKRQYTAAMQPFAAYLQASPKGVHAADASYYSANAALNLTHPDAERQYLTFLETYPDNPRTNNAYTDLGNFYYQTRQYDKTIHYLSRAHLDKLPKAEQAEIKFRLGYAYLSRKEFGRADTIFNQIKNTENAYTAASNYYASYLNVRSGKYEKALPGLEKADKDPAFRGMTPLLRTIIHYKQKRYAQAIASGEAALKDTAKVSGGDEIALLVAESYFQSGDFKAAAKNFDMYRQTNKGALLPAVRYRMAYSYFKAGEPDKAIEDFKLISAGTDTAAARKDSLVQYSAYYLGMAYVQKDNKAFALPAFDIARKTGPNRSVQESAWFTYGKINFDLGRYNEAIDIFKTYAIRFSDAPNESESNDLLSEAYLNTSDYDQALTHIGNLKKRSPRVDAAYQRVAFMKGTRLYNENQFSEANSFFESSLKFPNDSGVVTAAHFWAGEALSAGKNYTEALAHYDVLLKRPKFKGNEYYLRTVYATAYAYFNTKAYDKALPLFKEYTFALEKAENKLYYNDALIRLGDCYYTQKDYTNAIATFDKCIALNVPDADYAWYQKGVVQTVSEKTDEARRSFDMVVTKYGNGRFRDEALFQKARLDFEKGSYQTAASGFTELINTGTNRNILAYSYLNRGLANSNLKNYTEAAADFRKIIDEFPSHKTANGALLGLQDVLTATGKLDEFNEYLAKYKQANPDDKSLASVEFETAKNLYFDQKYDKAITGFEEYLQKYPGTALGYEAKFYLAESYYRQNDKIKSAMAHKDVVAENKSTNLNKSLARLGEIEMAEGKWQDAISRYHSLQALAKNKKEAVNAVVGMMEAAFIGGRYDTTATLANEIVNKGNAGAEALNKASLYLGKVDYANGNTEKALDEFIEVLNSAKDQNGAEAQYLMGEIQNKTGKYRESQETLFDLNKNFSAYRKWYDKSFLLIADNYTALNDTYNAKYALEKLVENSSDPAVKEAARQKLELLKTKKAQ